MRNLYKSYVSQSTEQLLELRDNFLELRNKGLFVDFKEDATLQQVLLVERGIESKIGCLASYADRFVAKMIDWIIVSFIFIMIVITTLKNNFFISTIGLDLLLQIPLVAYILFADGLRGGQSIEKKLVGIAVVAEKTRKPCGFLKSVIRNILLYLLYTIDLIFFSGCKRKRLGDILASTIVIKVKNYGKWPFYFIKVLLFFSALCWLWLLSLYGQRLFENLF